MDLFTAHRGNIHFTRLILCPAMQVYSRLEVLLDEVLWMMTVFPLKYSVQYETVYMFLSDGIMSGFCRVPWWFRFGLWHLEACLSCKQSVKQQDWCEHGEVCGTYKRWLCSPPCVLAYWVLSDTLLLDLRKWDGQLEDSWHCVSFMQMLGYHVCLLF